MRAVLAFLFVIGAVSHFSHHRSLPLTAPTHHLHTSLHYLSRVSKVALNSTENDYFRIVQVARNEDALMAVNEQFRNRAKMWEASSDPAIRDCEYNISFSRAIQLEQFHLLYPRHQEVSFHFTVQQHSCRTGSHIFGGASFSVFAYSEVGISECGVTDHWDDKYTIDCHSFVTQRGGAGEGRDDTVRKDSDLGQQKGLEVCIYVTVQLEYEHYDAVSEQLREWSTGYCPRQHLLWDNVTVCMCLDSDGRSLKLPHSEPDVQGTVKEPSNTQAHDHDNDHDHDHDHDHDYAKDNRAYSRFSAFSSEDLPNANVSAASDTISSHMWSGVEVKYYSGHWLKDDEMPASSIPSSDPNHQPVCSSVEEDLASVLCSCERCSMLHAMPSSCLLSAYAYKTAYKLVFPRPSLAVDNPTRWPAVTAASASLDTSFAREFSFHPYVIQSEECTARSQFSPQNASYNQSCRGGVESSENTNIRESRGEESNKIARNDVFACPARFERLSLFDSLSPPSSSSSSSSMAFEFIGASHMRYALMGLLQLRFNNTILNDLNFVPHQSEFQVGKVHFVSTTFAMSVENAIRDACARREKYFSHDYRKNSSTTTSSSSSSNAGRMERVDNEEEKKEEEEWTLTVQLGAWDLAAFPLRKSLRYEDSGGEAGEYGRGSLRSCLRLINAVLRGSVPCGNLVHVVLVTTVPYPACNNPEIGGCVAGQNFRTNYAIAALNAFILRSVMMNASSFREGLRVSVVDAFSIAAPRHLLNDNAEVVCFNHFSCAVLTDQGPRQRKMLTVAHSPAGYAIMQALLLAVSREH